MTKLTEDMVVARSKGSDLHNVRKLNCWGSELTDVSVVRKLQNVEVLSLSVNNIKTLADFQHCPHLQELYIRKNSITDINEVLYLRNLPKLKSLWLADNPCANFEQYRQTVLRALPHLQKLDNVAVDSEEVQQAMVCGVPLPLSDSSMGKREGDMPRSSSIGESLRSEGGGSSLSDCSPPASERRYSQTTTPTRATQQDLYARSVDDGYGYDDDDEQPVMRRTSYNQSADQERRVSQMSQYSNDGPYPQIIYRIYITTGDEFMKRILVIKWVYWIRMRVCEMFRSKKCLVGQEGIKTPWVTSQFSYRTSLPGFQRHQDYSSSLESFQFTKVLPSLQVRDFVME
ncbi:hypothetical protein SK128_003621 [Halocaridina rubra]|uniref:U2A'/phosphoprotein 32 family A C-terminal domain-containing protein n=1 Tax=Halocaridina rubra TaxID=373956 RepID=A0AAN8XND1_HALRR